ncbi:MAG: hypothetical protein Kow0098_01420 [Ignavibacteriaceae bacterium]
MFRHILFVFSVIMLFSAITFAQGSGENNIIHIQKWQLKSMPAGDDAAAFSDMVKRQSEVLNSDSRLLSFRMVRHFWGSDSRDLIFISEFNSMEEMASFYQDMGSMLESKFN